MRIRCERCKAEYEIDEHQVRGGHLEVQCSVCAHVFSVDRQAGPLHPSPTPEEGLWLVQTADGRNLPFTSVAALQASIQNGSLTPLDRCTRDQRTWQTLGDMPELAPYFGTGYTGRASGPRGCEPQEPAAANETSRFVLEPKSHGMVKVSVGLAVAAGVAFAGIRWQQDRNVRFQSRPMAASSSVVTRMAVPLPTPDTASAAQAPSDPQTPATSGAAGHRPVVEALPSPSAKREPSAPVTSAAAPPHTTESYERLVVEGDRALVNGATNRARELYQKALNQRPAGFKAMAGLGFVALDRGQLPVAYEYFKRALTAKTSFPPALFGIAEVHRARGEKSLAVHSYQRYLDMAPDGADAPAARRQLQNLQSGR